MERFAQHLCGSQEPRGLRILSERTGYSRQPFQTDFRQPADPQIPAQGKTLVKKGRGSGGLTLAKRNRSQSKEGVGRSPLVPERARILEAFLPICCRHLVLALAQGDDCQLPERRTQQEFVLQIAPNRQTLLEEFRRSFVFLLVKGN